MNNYAGLSPEEFCKKFDACPEGLEWALTTGCKTMADLWIRDDLQPDWRIWIATRPDVMDKKTARLFACWCARQVWHLLTDERSKHAVEVAERYAHGDATDEELAEARAAARAAASEAAWAAAWNEASEAARASVWGEARPAAFGAARAAARAADREEARPAQADWLIKNFDFAGERNGQ